MLTITPAVYDSLLAHARREAPRECCGLLAGPPAATTPPPGAALKQPAVASPAPVVHATVCYPLRNELASLTEYLGDARDMLHAFKDMRARGLELAAIYHSHPASAPVPSRTDLKRNFYPETPHLIVSLASEPPEVRAYLLRGDGYEEIAWQLGPP